MKRILLTGGSGKAGRACLADLTSHGYQVLIADTVPPPGGVWGNSSWGYVHADLTDFGQTLECFGKVDGRSQGIDAVVHLAAIPARGLYTNATTFRVNMLSTYNVFEAARQVGCRNVVWASSETISGLPFDTPPQYLPADEDYQPRPESAYSLSKWLGEQAAEQFCRWDPKLKIIGLRFSNIMEEKDYANFESWQDDPQKRKWNLWGYIDARDAASAVRLSLESTLTGAHVFTIANADTVMRMPNDDLARRVFPGVAIHRPLGAHDTLLAIDKARKMLGWEPMHGWRK
jgi:nucleoside-diphosphate-sugar epimerase